MIKNRITLKQLEALVFVVDRGTFKAAASALGTTQPNISSRISVLENALGITLFHRDAGSVRLTAKGAEVLEQARAVLRASEALIESANRHDLIDERLRLGVTELVACTWLQDFLRALRHEYPGLRVELLVDLSNQIEDHLTDGQIDLAIHNAPFRSNIDATLALTPEPYVWVASKAADLPAAGDVAAFFQSSVLTHARHTSAGDALHALAAERGFDPQRIVHSNALSACIPMACEGLGVAHLPRALVAAEIASGELLELSADWQAEPLQFFARYQASRAPRFVERAAAIAQALRPSR